MVVWVFENETVLSNFPSFFSLSRALRLEGAVIDTPPREVFDMGLSKSKLPCLPRPLLGAFNMLPLPRGVVRPPTDGALSTGDPTREVDLPVNLARDFSRSRSLSAAASISLCLPFSLLTSRLPPLPPKNIGDHRPLLGSLSASCVLSASSYPIKLPSPTTTKLLFLP